MKHVSYRLDWPQPAQLPPSIPWFVFISIHEAILPTGNDRWQPLWLWLGHAGRYPPNKNRGARTTSSRHQGSLILRAAIHQKGGEILSIKIDGSTKGPGPCLIPEHRQVPPLNHIQPQHTKEGFRKWDFELLRYTAILLPQFPVMQHVGIAKRPLRLRP